MKPNQTPPKLFLRFFRWYCHPKLVDHIEGDLLEEYGEHLRRMGKRKANIKFIIDVLLLFRPGIIRPSNGTQPVNTYSMYKSYFKTGWRVLLRNKGYSVINISGLALGMAIALMIGLWVHDELQFNTYFHNYDRIARVVRNITINNEILSRTYLPNTVGGALQSEYGAHFKRVVMASPVEEYFLTVDDIKLPLRGEFLDPAGTELFSLHMIHGSVKGLIEPQTIFLSESVANVLFGEHDPMGKLVKINNSMEAVVTGVYEDLPHNTYLHDAKFFAPLELLASYEPWMKEPSHTQNYLHVYVELHDQENFESVSNKIKNTILDNVRDNADYAAMNPQIFLQPMKDWHLYSEWKNGVKTGERAQIVWLFGIIGAFVLCLACINFMNLSTARSERRAKEVGIRKSIGSKRGQLMGQFYTESFIVVIFSFILALALTFSALSWFNDLAGKQITVPVSNIYFWMISFGFVCITSILAGTYPAMYLSSFNPIQVIKGWRAGKSVVLPRKVLVIVQFTISTILIIGTIIVYQQVQYAKNRPVGYTREGLIMIQKTSPDFDGKYDVFRNELISTGHIAEMSESSSPPTDIWTINSGMEWEGKDPNSETIFATLTVTPDYGKTVGWQFISGRDFSRDLASDSAAFVINQAAAKALGFVDPIGKEMRWSTRRSKYSSFTIIGVINDMMMGSPYTSSTPAVYFLSRDTHHFINIKINPNISANDALPEIQHVFEKIVPAVPFDYRFADQEYAKKFLSEERVGKLSSVFAVFAIFISCLGLFGLSSFVAEQRMKEIGIRKILGASVLNLWTMLSKEFVVLVFASSLAAVPVTFYLMENWLQSFEYRTQISPGIVFVIVMCTIALTLVTVSLQLVKAALRNPVKSLKSE